MDASSASPADGPPSNKQAAGGVAPPDWVDLASETTPSALELFWVRSSDGARIRVAVWQPREPARLSLLLLHGRTEFIEKYRYVAGEARRRGYRVVTFDFPGQGLSDRPLAEHPSGDREAGHIDTFDRYQDAVRVVMAATGLLTGAPPVVLAHSMGGVVALEAALRGQLPLGGLALSAPMLGIRAPAGAGLLAYAARARGVGAQRFRPTEPPEVFATNPVTTEPAEWQRARELLGKEPLLKLGPPTWGWIAAAYEAMGRARRAGRLEALRLPVLIASAGREMIVSNGAQYRAARLIKGATHVVYGPAKHEILMETDAIKARFWADFDAWTGRHGLRP